MGLKIGSILRNRFEVRSEIGKGAFGIVYLAQDRDLYRMVAIKELLVDNPNLGSTEFSTQKRKFEREARALGRFQHQNVVSVHQILHEEEGSYLVMEFVAGGSLEQRLERVGRLSPDASVAIAVDICHAIAQMSRHGIVHRDIKPSNILLMPDNSAKLTDFGVAQVADDSSRLAGRGSRHSGTPKYMSPEQRTSTAPLDQRSDLYTLGLVLYNMLTGQSYQKNRKSAHQVHADIPKALDAVLQKVLQENPDKRYQTAEEMERALVQSLHAAPSSRAAAPLSSRVMMGMGLVGIVALAAILIVPNLSGGDGNEPTPSPSSIPTEDDINDSILGFSTSTSTQTLTPTMTSTATNTPEYTDTPTPSPTDTLTPVPTTSVPPTRVLSTPTPSPTPSDTPPPECPSDRIWDPILNQCRRTEGGGGGGGPPSATEPPPIED